jgi:hypothetical protein
MTDSFFIENSPHAKQKDFANAPLMLRKKPDVSRTQ